MNLSRMLARKRREQIQRFSHWQQIFLLSKANGALYVGDMIIPAPAQWPENTWLANRLRKVRNERQGQR